MYGVFAPSVHPLSQFTRRFKPELFYRVLRGTLTPPGYHRLYAAES